jgi:hypothetical protein
MESSAARRLEVLGGQLATSTSERPTSDIAPQTTASTSQSSYASATGRPTSYARIHGEVSREAAAWNRIHSIGKEPLEEVKYEKAQGEGIAKVHVRGV